MSPSLVVELFMNLKIIHKLFLKDPKCTIIKYSLINGQWFICFFLVGNVSLCLLSDISKLHITILNFFNDLHFVPSANLSFVFKSECERIRHTFLYIVLTLFLVNLALN